MRPSIARCVHFQSLGTPGGEFCPAPTAAIITDAEVWPESLLGKGDPLANPTHHHPNESEPMLRLRLRVEHALHHAAAITYKLTPATDGNNDWSKWTPSAEFTFTVTNPQAPTLYPGQVIGVELTDVPPDVKPAPEKPIR